MLSYVSWGCKRDSFCWISSGSVPDLRTTLFIKRMNLARDEDTCWHGCKGVGACVSTHPRERTLVRLPAKALERAQQLLQCEKGDKHAIWWF